MTDLFSSERVERTRIVSVDIAAARKEFPQTSPTGEELSAPVHRTVIVVDAEGSTKCTNPERAWLRQTMYALLEESLTTCGITEWHRDPIVDRGDGMLIPVHPSDHVPKTRLLGGLVPTLRHRLVECNQYLVRPLRLRLAIHAGEIHYDKHGPFGEAVDVTCRLVDSAELKAALLSTTTPLVLAVSDDIHRNVIRHGYEGIDRRSFQPLIRLDMAGNSVVGWVHRS